MPYPRVLRFDSSISWLAAIGNQAALTVFAGPGAIYARNHELTTKLRVALTNVGWDPVDLPGQNQSTIVSVPLADSEPSRLLTALSGQGIICSPRNGHLRLAIHFYNHEDDIDRLVTAPTSANCKRAVHCWTGGCRANVLGCLIVAEVSGRYRHPVRVRSQVRGALPWTP